MALGDLLFSSYDLSSVLAEQERKAKEAVDGMNGDALLNSSPEDVCDALEEDFRVHEPVVKEEGIQQDLQEAKVDVSHDSSRAIWDRSQPVYIPGAAVTFFVPYDGDRTLFECRPSSFTLNPPRAEIRDNEIVLSYTRVDPDAAAIKQEFESDLASIRKHLSWVANDVQRFNGMLRPKLQGWIAARRDRILRDRSMVAALGYPLRRRPDAPTTYVAPAVRRKPAVTRITSTTKPFVPEATLDMAEYEHILAVISNMVHVMERSPHAFKGMKEEDLRQHFLVQLNGQYEGQATGETFNFEGKTDILIRAEDRSIFIAECKFWRGQDSLRETVDQLLGYASWRDTKTAILIFNRQKNFSDVLAKIPEVVKAHPNFKRQEQYQSETGFRFTLHHRDDKNRELMLTVLAFEVPA